MNVCAIEGCEKPHEARGWCNTHYACWRRTGSPLPTRASHVCQQPDCIGQVYAYGNCRMHHARLRRTGTVAPPVVLSIAERLLAKREVDATGCWLWQGVKTPGGYGQASSPVNRDRMVYAHRLAYETFVGPIPDGLQIDHLCRVRHCINPTHLEPVTAAENLRRAREARSTA